MTPLYQDTKGPSQHVYAYSQEMGSLATKSFFQNPLLSLKACLGPPKSGIRRKLFLSLLPLAQKMVSLNPKITPGLH